MLVRNSTTYFLFSVTTVDFKKIIFHNYKTYQTFYKVYSITITYKWNTWLKHCFELTVYIWIRPYFVSSISKSSIFCVVFCRPFLCAFVLFLLTIVLSVLKVQTFLSFKAPGDTHCYQTFLTTLKQGDINIKYYNLSYPPPSPSLSTYSYGSGCKDYDICHIIFQTVQDLG